MSQKFWEYKKLLNRDENGKITNIEKIIYDNYKHNKNVMTIFETWEFRRDTPIENLVNKIIKSVKYKLYDLVREQTVDADKLEMMDKIDKILDNKYTATQVLYTILNRLVNGDDINQIVYTETVKFSRIFLGSARPRKSEEWNGGRLQQKGWSIKYSSPRNRTRKTYRIWSPKYSISKIWSPKYPIHTR